MIFKLHEKVVKGRKLTWLSIWQKVKKVGLLGDVDDDEVGNVVHPCGDKVDVDLAKRAWQIYQQVAVG